MAYSERPATARASFTTRRSAIRAEGSSSSEFLAKKSKQVTARGFTLAEMLVSITILLIIAAVLSLALTMVSNANHLITSEVGSFQDAELAFQSFTRTLSQASLNTYWDYYPSQSGTSPSAPQTYIRQSSQHFITGYASNLVTTSTGSGNANTTPTHAVFFQAPLGYATTSSYVAAPDLLNAIGYYIQFGPNTSQIPPLSGLMVNVKYRFRLMEMIQPTELLEVYTDTATSPDSGSPTTSYKWITDPISQSLVHIVADNVIALVIEPQYSAADLAANSNVPLTSNYTYDSRLGTITYPATPPALVQPVAMNQLPSLVKVTMVAIDETSAIHLAALNGISPPTQITNILNGSPTLFTSTSVTVTPTQYNQDMATLTNGLTAAQINYRVFTAIVPIRAAKWSVQ